MQRRTCGGSAMGRGRPYRIMGSCKPRALLCLACWAAFTVTPGFGAEGASTSPPVSAARDESGPRWRRLAAIAGVGLGAHYVGFRYFDRAWYQGQRQDHIRWLHDWEGDTYLHLDKGGHFMGGMFLSTGLRDAFGWAGFGSRSAALLGTLTSWAALLEIEMRDAYYDQWGFSLPDFTANTLGAAVPLIHTLLPASRVIGFKFSYWPSSLYLDHDRRRDENRPHAEYAIDDYEGMTFWVTLALDEVLRGKARQVWPDHLGLAVGYGASGMHGSNVKSRGRERHYNGQDGRPYNSQKGWRYHLPSARPEIFVGLDYDLRAPSSEGSWWRQVQRQLSWVHLPMPAVRVYPNLGAYLLYM